MELAIWSIGGDGIFTARKRSLRRLYFYTCLSVILFSGRGGGSLASQHALGRGVGFPACAGNRDLHPRGDLHPGWGVCIQGEGGLHLGGCWADPPLRYMRYYGIWSTTHPTGMFSCFIVDLSLVKIVAWI